MPKMILPTDYYVVESGSTCETNNKQHITTKEECENAAKQQGYSGSLATAREVDSPNNIPFCYRTLVPGFLVFNKNAKGTGQCSDKYKAKCICKNTRGKCYAALHI